MGLFDYFARKRREAESRRADEDRLRRARLLDASGARSSRSTWDDSPMNPVSPSGMISSPLSPISPSYAGADYGPAPSHCSSPSYGSSDGGSCGASAGDGGSSGGGGCD